VWGVLSTASAEPEILRHWTPVLAASLDGLVATGPLVPGLGGCRWETPASAVRTPLQSLLTGLRGVPDDVDDVVFLEGAALETLVPSDVTEMLGWLTADVAAVVRGAPVTDALKRVDGDRLLGVVDRVGLLTIQTPHVLRRRALDEALLVLPDGGPQDPAALLIAAGHAVRMFHATPSAVRSPQTAVAPAPR